MQRFNIYITESEKDKANTIQQKYKISLSTMVSILAYTTYYCLKHYGTKDLEDLQLEYVDTKCNYKTSIKPRCMKDTEILAKLITNKSIYLTNVLKLYLSRNIAKYLTKKGLEYYYNDIDKKFQTAKEVFWNYNNVVRSNARAIKNNKEYYQRLLKEWKAYI